MSQYPEHDKQSAILDKTQAIGEFLEWANYEKGLVLCRWNVDMDQRVPAGDFIPLLAEFFEVDLGKIEEEKRQMLEVMRELNGGEK